MDDRSTLGALGWDDRFSEAFAPYAEDGLSPGRVTAEHRAGYVVANGSGDDLLAVARGRLRDAAILSGGLPAVGDWVVVTPQPGLRAVIEAVLPRRTAVTRKIAWSEADEQVIAANVDVLFVVTDLDHDFNLRRLERYLVMAYETGAAPVIILTKLDLCRDPALVDDVEAVAIGVPVIPVSNVTGEGLEAVAAHLTPGRTVALIGSSGVGKSTLVNSLAGRELMPTGAVRSDGRGRHTTTHRELLTLPGGALLIDTPGLRELQLWEGDVDGAFSDLLELAATCRFADCVHESEPGCAVTGAIESGALDRARLSAYRKLERELEAVRTRGDKRVAAERKRRWRQRARETRSARKHGWKG